MFRDGECIGAGPHVEFTVDPDGFTNVQEGAGADTQTGRELAVYCFNGGLSRILVRKREIRPRDRWSGESPTQHARHQVFELNRIVDRFAPAGG